MILILIWRSSVKVSLVTPFPIIVSNEPEIHLIPWTNPCPKSSCSQTAFACNAMFILRSSPHI